MSKIREQNQLHPARKKYPGEVDEGVNSKRKLWYKDGHSTMLFCKDITKPAATCLIQFIKENAAKLGVEIQGNFLITQLYVEGWTTCNA